MRPRTMLALVMAAASLGACGGGSHASTATQPTAATEAATTASTDAPTTTAPPPPDPCKLVSAADAQAIVQIGLQPAVESGQPPDQMCQYTSPPTGPTAQVEVFVGDGAKKALDIDKDELKHDFTTLSGIGDEAYLEADNVFLRKGSIWAQVNVVALDTPADHVQTALQSIAHKIAGELP